MVVTSTKYRYLSSDDAKRWLSYENFVLDQPIYAIAWSSGLSEFAAGGLFHTICSSKDGVTWEKRASSIGVPRYLINCMIWDSYQKLLLIILALYNIVTFMAHLLIMI